MSDTVKVHEYMEQGNYVLLLDALEDNINKDLISSDEWKEVLVRFEMLYQNLSSQHHIRAYEVLFFGFLKTENYGRASKYIYKLKDIKPREWHYKEITELLKKLGEVDKLRNIFDEYMSYLFKKKSLTVIENEILKFSEYIDPKLILDWKIKVIVYRLDRKGFEKVLEENRKLGNNELFILRKFFSLVNNREISMWFSKSIAESVFRHVDNLNNFLTKKMLIKILMDYISSSKPDEREAIDYINISKKWNLMYLGYIYSKKISDSENEDYFLLNMPNELMKDEEFDYGEDLLNSISDKPEEEAVKKVISEKPKPSLIKYSKLIEKDPARVYLDDIDIDTLKESYNDVIASMHMFENYEYALRVLNNLLEEKLNRDTYVDVVYLKAETLLKSGMCYEARDLLNDFISNEVLVDSERVVFYYLMAQIYEELKEYEKAKHYFERVKDLSPQYRLTKDKLQGGFGDK